MTLPTQIQAQVDQAKSIIAQHYPIPAGDADATSTPEAKPAETTLVVESSVPPPAPESAAVPASSADTEDENSPTFAQRWRTLQGRYNALLRQHEETTGRIGSLEQLVAQMQIAPAAAPAQPTQAPATVVSDEDLDREGTDRIELIHRIVRAELAPMAQAMQMLNSRLDKVSNVVPVVDNLATVQHQTAQQRFYADLRNAVPSWQVINDDPRFHEWLMAADPLTAIDRQTYLRDAERKLDSSRVISIFQAGMAALGIEAPQSTLPDNTLSAPARAGAASAASRLEKQVAPGRSTATEAPQPAAKRKWTRAEIAAFYNNRLRGAFRGREAEAKATEADIFSAQAEGRVVA